jgi:hypothetical protein
MNYREDLKERHLEMKTLCQRTKQCAWEWKILDEDLTKYYHEMTTE